MTRPAEAFKSLSIVVPAYNAAGHVATTLDAIQSWMERSGLPCEIIVVDDGSRDETRSIVERRGQGVRVLSYGANRGKGFAVRQGMLAATCEWILFTDVDHATDITHLEQFASHAATCDVLIGSRRLAESRIVRRQPRFRQTLGRMFPYLVQALVLPSFADTQCGFKLFRRPVAQDLFARARVDRFCFDVEVLAMALRAGYRVCELPVQWRNPEGGSTLRIGTDSVRMMYDLFRLAIRFGRVQATLNQTHTSANPPLGSDRT